MSRSTRRSLNAARAVTGILLGHYAGAARAREKGKSIAWCTAVSSPIEILYAFGIHPLFPENYACVCSTRGVTADLFKSSESKGFSKDLCSYSRCVLSSIMGGQTILGGLEKPDLLFSARNVCVTYLKWWQAMARELKCPLYVIDCPRVIRNIENYHVNYIASQLQNFISELEKLSKTKLDEENLKETVKLSDKAGGLWRQTLNYRKTKPCPIGVTDSSAAMFPLVAYTGTMTAVKYYKWLLSEVSRRVKDGVGVIDGERFRLLLSGIPFWHHLKLFNYLEDKYGAVFVFETYTAAWGHVELNSEKPLKSLAVKALKPVRMPIDWYINWVERLVEDYKVDGVVMFSTRSCKATSMNHALVKKALSDDLGVPGIIIDADHTDERAYSDAIVMNKLDTFMEMLGAKPT